MRNSILLLVGLAVGTSGAAASAQDEQLGSELWFSPSPPLPDGRTIAAPCEDGSVRLFDVATGETIRVLTGHTADAHAVVGSPDGSLLATPSKDGTVRLWDLESGECRAVLDPGGDVDPFWRDTLEFSRDGSMLVAVPRGAGTRATVWDVETGETLFQPPADLGVEAAAWSPDSTTLVTVGTDRCAHFWDMPSGAESGAPLEHPEPLYTVAFHPDGSRLAVGGGGVKAWLWCATDRRILARATLGEPVFDLQSIQQLVFTPDGDALVATTGGFWNVFLCDAVTLRERWRIDFGGGSPAPMTVAFDSAGDRIALSNKSMIVSRDGETRQALDDLYDPRFTRNGRIVVARRIVAHADRPGSYATTVVLDADTLEPIYERVEYPDGEARITRHR